MVVPTENAMKGMNWKFVAFPSLLQKGKKRRRKKERGMLGGW